MTCKNLLFVALVALLAANQVASDSAESAILCEGLKSGGFCDEDPSYMAETCGETYCQPNLDDPDVIIEEDIAGLTHEELKKRVSDDNDLLQSEASILKNARSGLAFKSALKDSRYHWPNGRVPYIISSTYTSGERQKILSAMKELEQKTCIRFVAKTSSDISYISIESRSGCYSYLGKIGRGQVLSLNRHGCLLNGIIQHELMHALSFIHEQSRPDRDNYISILWGNINSAYHSQFQKVDYRRVHLLGSYDYGSVMHYGNYAFSSNGRESIRTRNGARIGQRRAVSNSDVAKINKLYCAGQPITGTTRPSRSCEDKIRYCYVWKYYGMCNNNGNTVRHSIMKQGCAKTCNLCD